MGYAHSWSRIETPAGPLPAEPAGAYGRLALDTLRIFAAADRAGIALADGTATPGTRPVVDEGGIWFNGARPDHCETFAWPAQPGEPWWTELPGHRWWDACKTNRQHYDTVVCAVLIRAGFHYRDSIRVSSDGAWDGSIIDGQQLPEWTAARAVVVDLFGPAADVNPLVGS